MKIHSREYWKAMLPIVQAFAEGKKVSHTDQESGESFLTFMGFNSRPEQYKVYPDTHIVNGFEVPAPEKEGPPWGAKYYTPDLVSTQHNAYWRWEDGQTDRRLLSLGLVHLTARAAIENSLAMCGIDPRGEI